jgi:hypothetical protein
MRTARRTPIFQEFQNWSRYPIWWTAPAGVTKVQITDLRFAIPGENRCVATALVDANLRVTRAWFQFDNHGDLPRFR